MGDERQLTLAERRARALAMGGEHTVVRRDGTTVEVGTARPRREVRWGQTPLTSQLDNARTDDGALDLVKAQAWLLGCTITS